MWTPLRVWYYTKFVKNEAWPSDVREYVVRRGLKRIDRSNSSPEQQEEIAIKEISAALQDDELSPELMADLLEDGLKRLKNLPVKHCTACGVSILAHDAIITDGKPYCKNCLPR